MAAASLLGSRQLAVLEVRSERDYLQQIIAFCNSCGYERVTALWVRDTPGGEPVFRGWGNAPETYLRTFEDLRRARKDPVMQRAKRSSLPFVWDQAFYGNHAAMPLWEEQVPHGYGAGLCITHHMPSGRHFALGLSARRHPDRPASGDALSRVCAFASFAAVAAERFELTMPQQPQSPMLSPIELECVRWTADGKTVWEIGRIVAKSERAVAGYLGAAMRRLNCVNKYQLVAKAVRLGWVG